ncbi:hypothetical protein FGO68_gene13254 [Halteria grandinella]|uniref:Beta-hexosaminidase n=1 Tax=Halteria grandinella TaxID=5974 RepID=A0A8J8NSI1_HALGN|nr:hypothetical protein FGO68_gene13254 [Halteria grandinella]
MLGLGLALTFMTSALAYQFDNAKDPAYPVLLPTPRNLTFGSQTALIDPCFFAVTSNVTMKEGDTLKVDPKVITANIQEYVTNKVFYKGSDCPATANYLASNVVGLTAEITHQTADLLPPDLEDGDESYTLQVNSSAISIVANQYSGIIRALATLAQLTKYSYSTGRFTYAVKFAPINITDSPRYPYRGFMLDTSRRFFQESTLLQTLDILAAAKFNVFHWHIVDDDSFPFNLTTYPNVTKGGAFTPEQVYSVEQVKNIVAHAEKLGIRVVPEFDNPGHTRAVGFDSYFNEAIRCFMKDWSNNVPDAYRINGGPPTGVLDPSFDKTYELLVGIFTDFNTLFPDNMVHLGGDEVLQSCFNENPNLAKFMEDNNITDYDQLIVWHMAKARYTLQNINRDKKALYWSNEDTFYQEYKDGDILVYWGLAQNITNMTDIYPNQKYVMAPGDYYYMDCGFGNKYGEKAWCDPFKTWWKIYSFDPSDYITGTQCLGSEIAVWSELNGDQNLNVKLWPRGAAMADKLWSDKVPTDLVAIVQRQVAFAEYLNDRGIATSSVVGRWCEKNADHCFAAYPEAKAEKVEELFAATE